MDDTNYLSETIQNTIIKKELLANEFKKKRPSVDDSIPFGAIQTDHMLVCDFLPAKGGWQLPKILPYTPFSLNPSALVFHYGQTIFEGLKAYRGVKNKESIFLFRPEKNATRFYDSAVRLGMEPLPESLFIQCVKELVLTEKEWLLPQPAALYIRPAMIPLEEGVSYRASQMYRFFIIVSPAKSYFNEETSISVYIERKLSRAAIGGSGEAKCGGNYASALPSLNIAKGKGAHQVLWLDAFEHKYVEEAGAMNVMFVYDKQIITPPLSGSILAGVTRDSILHIAKILGYSVSEEKIEINKIIADAKSGALTEMFACGTAAIVSPISSLIDENEKISINNEKIGEVTLELKKRVLGIQNGLFEDPMNWRMQIC